MNDTIPFLKNGRRLNHQIYGFSFSTLVFFILSLYTLIVKELFVLSFFFIPITLFFAIMSFSRYSQKFNTLSLYGSSFEIGSRRRHDIIPFEDIISVKLQYREELPGFMVFHPIDLISSLFSWAQGKETIPQNQVDYEIETDYSRIYNYFVEVDPEAVSFFIERIFEETGMRPLSQEFQYVDYVGKVFYFSFRDLNTELDPDSVRELL